MQRNDAVRESSCLSVSWSRAAQRGRNNIITALFSSITAAATTYILSAWLSPARHMETAYRFKQHNWEALVMCSMDCITLMIMGFHYQSFKDDVLDMWKSQTCWILLRFIVRHPHCNFPPASFAAMTLGFFLRREHTYRALT